LAYYIQSPPARNLKPQKLEVNFQPGRTYKLYARDRYTAWIVDIETNETVSTATVVE